MQFNAVWGCLSFLFFCFVVVVVFEKRKKNKALWHRTQRNDLSGNCGTSFSSNWFITTVRETVYQEPVAQLCLSTDLSGRGCGPEDWASGPARCWRRFHSRRGKGFFSYRQCRLWSRCSYSPRFQRQALTPVGALRIPRAQELCEGWGGSWKSWAPVPNKPTVSVDVKQHFNQHQQLAAMSLSGHTKILHTPSPLKDGMSRPG